MKPENPEYQVKGLDPDDPNGSGDSQAPLFFRSYEEIEDAAPSSHLDVPEPSVGENGQTVMTTGNFWMSLSEDGGQTFTSVNPTTIFPEDYGGFCCDQVLQYVPKYDMFVWLLQYRAMAGVNAIRIAVQTTQGVRNSNGTAWTYWDFTNTTFATSGELDYNDMSFGSQFLYWSSSVGGGANRYVIRVPLKELQAMGTVNFQFTGSTAAFWSHVTQNGTSGVYWAGHKNNSTMIVGFGGGTYNASSGVGVWGDCVIYYPRLSSSSRSNYGHYHTVRRAGSDSLQWVGTGYTRQDDGSNLPYYVRFSR